MKAVAFMLCLVMLSACDPESVNWGGTLRYWCESAPNCVCKSDDCKQMTRTN